jgi:hypothetical protein
MSIEVFQKLNNVEDKRAGNYRWAKFRTYCWFVLVGILSGVALGYGIAFKHYEGLSALNIKDFESLRIHTHQTQEYADKLKQEISDLSNELTKKRSEIVHLQNQIRTGEVQINILTTTIDEIKNRFTKVNVIEKFSQNLSDFKSAGMGRLEVGIMNSTVTKEISKDTIIGNYKFFTTIAKIQCPVTYRYHVDLNGDWQIKVDGNTCVVRVPRLAPSLPVAIHSDEMKQYSQGSWSRFFERSVVNEAVASLTPEANKAASEPSNMDAVRPGARKVVANFVKNWLLAYGGWSNDKVNSIIVTFDDDSLSATESTPALSLH